MEGFKVIKCDCGDKTKKARCWRGTSIVVHHDHRCLYFNHTKDKTGTKKEKFRGSIYLTEKSIDSLINELKKLKKQ